mmetsp:Transcript_33922/g.40646  ORF Transcript_33922/g.40646 Transcript_33922/m.40646 type:complete len:360 (+) Transcript_33922:66-1145(+)|eukprot:CAMPEP_0198270006 /NCGR_PEP_ID=MMETSP1447-20131203/43419_1 /TAXON_ID=420782 /ORGANISM="Chaetoceros dichaeta, Strain CCMP1751" /LENGTH=359 /DNA_ID=CAMNT_0043961841 /DNA_START=54 /DNA_END=1133 /DNA_ORIENTATION=+
MANEQSQLVQEQDSNNKDQSHLGQRYGSMTAKEARRETDRLYIEKRRTDVAILDAQMQVEEATLFLEQVEAEKTAADKAVLDGAVALADVLLEEDTTWNKRYKELFKYKETHGHCNIKCTLVLAPERVFHPKNNELEAWTQQVRLQALKPPKDPEHLEPYKINALNSLGFDWQTSGSIWLQEYLNLKSYMDKHGRGKIPNMRKNALGVWCAEQIIAYNKFQSETDSAMNVKKIILMNHIGFIWDTRPAIWMQRYTTLVEFRDKNGHCRVPASHKNQILFRWVVRERKKYRNFLAKKIPTQTDEQRNLLDSLDFVNSLLPAHRNGIKIIVNNDDASDVTHDATHAIDESSSIEEDLECND